MNSLSTSTLGALLDDVARLYPGRNAVTDFATGERTSYSELRDRADRIARGLMAAGVGKGDHVAIWSTNSTEWVITLFAVAKIGAALVTVNTNNKMHEMEYLLAQSDSTTLLLGRGSKDSDYLDIISTLCPSIRDSAPGRLCSVSLPRLTNLVFLGTEKQEGMYLWSDLDLLAGQVSKREFQGRQETLSCHDVVNIQYTSGTTGFPKGVMLSHCNILNSGMSVGEGMKLTHEDRLCVPVPLFHCFGLVLGVLAAVTHGSSIVILDHFDPLLTMRAIQEEGCTAVHGVPTMFISMIEHPDFHTFEFPRLRTGIMAGAPCPVRIMEQVVERMGAKDMTIVFGQTEASPACTQTRIDDPLSRRVSTVGVALPGVEVAVVDPTTGQHAGANTEGELVVRGYNVMKGYYKMEEATDKAVDGEGWLHTQDLAAMDEKGYVKITGRMKDMIIRGGENISPKEIEEYLYRHPAVKDVQVIGVPSKRYGEEVMAYIILKAGLTATEDDIREYVRANLSRYKTPRYVSFINEFPMTASGKIQKYRLRERAIEELGLQEAAAVHTA